jgi:hypothetical protein
MSEYVNRYGDKFTFEKNENGNIQWSGDFKYTRYGFEDNPKDVTMVDPSGGPYITLGMDLTLYGSEGIVKGFIENDNGYELVIDK